jgi:hypothetical protein
MQNLHPAAQEGLARQIELISKTKTHPVIKSRMLGLAIMNVMGTKVLICAVESLGNLITVDVEAQPIPKT